MKIKKEEKRVFRLISYWIIIQVGFLYSANPGDIIITEFFFNKSAGTLPEYVELFNTTESSINLQGWNLGIDGVKVEIDVSFEILSHDYAAVLSSSGLLRNENGTTFCSSSHYGFPFNVCDTQIDSLFWRIGTFADLSNTSGTIKIWDNAETSNVIDSVAYDMSADFPVGDEILGQSAVFIIDPSFENADVKNDVGNNWRSSQHPSDYLWNGSSSDFGSPLSSNFITPSISIDGIINSNADTTVCSYTSNKTICLPQSDGYPGGYADIKLIGSAINFSGTPITIDSLYWEINKENTLVDIKNDSIYLPIPLLQDTHLTSSIYKIPLITRSKSGLLGKTDTTIYVNQEINEKPNIFKINGQSSQAEINIFENTYDSLYAEVTDIELCPSVDTPCNFDSLSFNSSYFDNSSPFLWTSTSSQLLSSTSILVPKFTAPQIDSIENKGANFIQDTLYFYFKATDPFGETDLDSIKVIVHNKNQKPIIELNTENINTIELISGYSNRLSIMGNQIELYEYDASGVKIDTTIIGQITDIDNDLTFTIIPTGKNCNIGFENNYCVSGTTIKTNHKVVYDSLMIPFVVDDGVHSPISGFLSESTSDTSYLVIKNINRITQTVNFDNPINSLDGIFYLPEDSTLISEISFYIDFNLNGVSSHTINWDSLQWAFEKLDSESEQRVFAYKTINGFLIDSLTNNYNGETGLKVSVTDSNNTVSSLADSIIINIPIFIEQRNDTLKQFNLYHDFKDYNLFDSTIDTIRGDRYFRLAQLSSDNYSSNPIPKKLRFEWEKNDELDLDVNANINKDSQLDIYYRLELIDTLTNIVSILKDSLNHNDFTGDENIWAEIEFKGKEFPFYGDSLGYDSQLDMDEIDINGLSTYRWRVVASNYWQDGLGFDPVEISQEWNSTDLKIDLIQPEITNMNIILNDLYPGFYDILWSSTESLITDSTFLSISEETNLFSAVSMLNPRWVSDSLFHFTGMIPTDLKSVIITYDLQIRDNAMNSGERIDEVSIAHVIPDSSSILSLTSLICDIRGVAY